MIFIFALTILNFIYLGLGCSDLYQKGTRTDGVYTIEPDGLGAFKVRCDMTTSGGGGPFFATGVG